MIFVILFSGVVVSDSICFSVQFADIVSVLQVDDYLVAVAIINLLVAFQTFVQSFYFLCCCC